MLSERGAKDALLTSRVSVELRAEAERTDGGVGENSKREVFCEEIRRLLGLFFRHVVCPRGCVEGVLVGLKLNQGEQAIDCVCFRFRIAIS